MKLSFELSPLSGNPAPANPGWLLTVNPHILPPNCPRPWGFIFTKCTVNAFGYALQDGFERVTRHFQFGRIHLFTWVRRADCEAFPKPKGWDFRFTLLYSPKPRTK